MTVARRSLARMFGALVFVAAGMAPCLAGAGNVYRWVDERGVVHLTDVPTDRRFEPVRITPRGLQTRPQRRDPNAFDALIVQAARRHGLPPALVKAVVHAESAFDPFAISRKGAVGLMQLMPATAAHVGVRDPFRPDENLLGGSLYLRHMVDRYRNWILALAAYNAGPRAVDRHQGVPPYQETRQYVRRVLHYYRLYYDELR